MKQSTLINISGAAVVPIFLTWAGTATAYWIRPISGFWPLSIGGLLLGFAFGLLFLQDIEFRTSNRKWFATALYTPMCLLSQISVVL